MESILFNFVVIFKGEEGVAVGEGGGGVRRDFFSAGTSFSETEYAAGIF